jgi:hypothetical protein
MVKFRFQDLKIWQLAIEIANELFDIADDLEQKRLYRFVEHLRAAGMSMFNPALLNSLRLDCSTSMYSKAWKIWIFMQGLQRTSS